MGSEQGGPGSGDGAELEQGGFTHWDRSVFVLTYWPERLFSHSETQPLHLQIGIITHLKSDENTQQEPWPGSRARPHEHPSLFSFLPPSPSLLLHGEAGQGDNEKTKISFPFIPFAQNSTS